MTSLHPTTATTAVDLKAARALVTQQAAWFEAALRLGIVEPGLVARALAAHEEAHAAWLGLLSGLRRDGRAAAVRRVEALWELHGGVVATLERPRDAAVGAEVLTEVRAVLADGLAALAEAALDAIAGDC